MGVQGVQVWMGRVNRTCKWFDVSCKTHELVMLQIRLLPTVAPVTVTTSQTWGGGGLSQVRVLGEMDGGQLQLVNLQLVMTNLVMVAARMLQQHVTMLAAPMLPTHQLSRTHPHHPRRVKEDSSSSRRNSSNSSGSREQ